MMEPSKRLFERFGRLETWIVGLQYHEGACAGVGQEVLFERDPDNPFDPNAVAAFTLTGKQIGHLPRYDAEHLSPLLLQGVIALKGHAGKLTRGDRLPLLLEVYATSKVSEILVRDSRDDWRAIYHNGFIDLWEHLADYSAASLGGYRERFRTLAHRQDLFPKTKFLYRMLKAHIADLETQDRQRLRDRVLASVRSMNFGGVSGWPEVTVIPLDAGTADTTGQAMLPAPHVVEALAPAAYRLPDLLRLLPSRCPYPGGARGLVVLVYGRWQSLDWFDTPEEAQVQWFQIILWSIEQALEESPPDLPAFTDLDAVKAGILERIQNVEFIKQNDREDSATQIDFDLDDLRGAAVYREGNLRRFIIGKEYPPILYDIDRQV